MTHIASSDVAGHIASTQLTVVTHWPTPKTCLTTSVVSPQLHLCLSQLPRIYTHTHTHRQIRLLDTSYMTSCYCSAVCSKKQTLLFLTFG